METAQKTVAEHARDLALETACPVCENCGKAMWPANAYRPGHEECIECELKAVLADLAMGAEMMLAMGPLLPKSFLRYAEEVKRVATAGVKL